MAVLLILTLCSYILLDVHRITWARTIEPQLDNNGLENKKDIYSWIIKNTKADAIIASDSPWMVYKNTKRPSIIFSPNIEKQGKLNSYITTYHVSYIISGTKLQKPSVFFSNGITIYCGAIYKK